MAEELLTKYPSDIAALTLLPSGGGRYEVTVNGDTIFSKAALGRFPEPDEIHELLKQRR
jgi:selenoprotein W-related protein